VAWIEMRASSLAPIILLTALLSGCSSHYSIGDLAGKYVLSVDGGTDTIELGKNGTYIHTYKAKTAQVDQQEGKWTFENLQAGPTVVLNDFRRLLGKDAQRPVFYLLLVKKSFGTYYLITDIDLNEGYKKQPQ
jgi:hypothetical protein